jgi:hypothetical protein
MPFIFIHQVAAGRVFRRGMGGGGIINITGEGGIKGNEGRLGSDTGAIELYIIYNISLILYTSSISIGH